jgi:lipid-A-disaccharide synthase
VGLPNIIAGEEVVRELLQNDMTPQNIADSLREFIESPEKYTATVRKLVSLKKSLGSKKPSVEVTNLIKEIGGITGNG